MSGTARFPGIAGEDLNRCERVTAHQTQDYEVSKKGCFAASSQWVFADEICDCTLVWVRCEIEILPCWKKAFLYRLVLHELKSLAFLQPKSISSPSCLAWAEKSAFFANQTLFIYTSLSFLSSNATLFYKPKAFLLYKPLFVALKNRPFRTKSFQYYTSLSVSLSKAPLFHPPSPIRITLNLLFAKNTAVLLMFA